MSDPSGVLPSKQAGDYAHTATKAALSMIPVAGGPAAELFALILAPPLERRRDEWLEDLYKRLKQLEAKVAGFHLEDLERNEAFVSAALQATRAAVATHQQEKRAMLRNALLRIAVGKGPNEEMQQIYLDAIEAFTPSHINVLNVLWRGTQELVSRGLWDPTRDQYSVRDYGNAITLLHPELKGQDGLLQYIMTELSNRGFSRLGAPDAVFPQSPAITNMGINFLQFVLDPEALPK